MKVHWNKFSRKRGFLDQPACGAKGGRLTRAPRTVTCMRCRHNHGYGKALEYEKRWEKGARKAIERLIETANAIKPFAA